MHKPTSLDNTQDVHKFWSKVHKTKTCWLWTGAKSGPYGSFSSKHFKSRQAHRISYELSVEPLNTHMAVDHICRNKLCVNPDHLEAVTRDENSRRAQYPRYCKAYIDAQGNYFLIPGNRKHANLCKAIQDRINRLCRKS